MPYVSINELPDGVRTVLPKHAQEIYKEAYNSAYDRRDTLNERCDDKSCEPAAHRVAWAAVKKAGYKKGEDERWHQQQKQK